MRSLAWLVCLSVLVGRPVGAQDRFRIETYTEIGPGISVTVLEDLATGHCTTLYTDARTTTVVSTQVCLRVQAAQAHAAAWTAAVESSQRRWRVLTIAQMFAVLNHRLATQPIYGVLK